MTSRVSRPVALWLCAAFVGFISHGALLAAEPGGTAEDAQDLAFWEELAFWDAIKDSKDPDEYRAYLNTYPQGRFAALARLRIEALSSRPNRETRESTANPSAGRADTHAGGRTPTEPPHGKTSSAGTPLPRSTSPSTGEPPQLIRDCDDCPQLVVIPPGRFQMGSAHGRPDERPVHLVQISRPFAIGVYEVTAGEWDVCVREGSCRYNPSSQEGARTPISNVSLEDAQQYLRWLTAKTKKTYRLPSEAEWEYAARAGTATDYWWGNGLKAGMANCTDCRNPGDGKGKTPIGSFKPNGFGLYDVHGNVWEWVADCWNSSYKRAPTNGQPWVRGDCLSGVLRGGSWNLDHDYMRVSRRIRYDRDVRYYLNGFRVARSLDN